jgi:Zn-dependent protease
MLDLLFSEPLLFIIMFGGIILAIGIHEASHCFMADYLGDPTPRSLGRTTLNPLAHLDPWGTLAILITGFFGWGKPAPFDPYNLQNPKRDIALIALAGPLSNIIMAIGLSALARFIDAPYLVETIFRMLIRMNLGLAVFNMLPVPPLDGSKVLGLFLSHETALKLQYGDGNSRWWLLLIVMPIFGGVSLASIFVSPIVNFLFGLLT